MGRFMSQDEEKFFNEMYNEMYRQLIGFTYRICDDVSFSEDVVQETFIELYRNIDKLMEHPRPKAWLYIAVKNKMMKMGKKNGVLYPLKDESLVVKTEEKSYKEIELAETIKNVVGERDYRMFCDYVLNGYSSVEVAEKYDVDKGGIRMRISRLKRKLALEIPKNWIIFLACMVGGFYGL